MNGFSREGPHSKPVAKSVFNYNICSKKFNTQDQLMKHMDQHTNDGDWNCDDCAHQTNSSDNLKRHLDITHHKSQKIKTPAIQEFPCSLCTLKCQDKSELENHRKRTHKSFKPCRNLPDCQYASKCIFNHSKVDSNIFVCYECCDELKAF